MGMSLEQMAEVSIYTDRVTEAEALEGRAKAIRAALK